VPAAADTAGEQWEGDVTPEQLRLMVFHSVWDYLEFVDAVDAAGGMQYRRILALWKKLGEKDDRAVLSLWIRYQANIRL